MSNTVIDKPRLRVQVEDDHAQITEYDVQTDNRDAVAFDLVRTRRGWPDGQAAPVVWMTFQAWSALTRSKAIDMKVETFFDRCVSVLPINDDGEPLSEGEQGVVATPTLPGHAPD